MKKLIILILLIFVISAYAAIDSQNKRAAVIGNLLRPIYPVADGTIDAYDRGQTIGVYPLGGTATTGSIGYRNRYINGYRNYRYRYND